MARFDFTNKLNFNEVDLTPPNIVAKSIGNEIAEATKGIIRVGVDRYEGIITETKPTFATSIAGMFQQASRGLIVQADMGKLGEEINQYEVYLYTPSYAVYRFRLMFIRYGVATYPAEIIMEQGVANALLEPDTIFNADSIICVDSKESLDAFIEKVLTTQYVLDIMQELIRVDQLQLYRNKQRLLKKIENSVGRKSEDEVQNVVK